MRLTGSQWNGLFEALLDAFEFNSLRSMLRAKLDRDLLRIASAEVGMESVVIDLIGRAEQEGWTLDLVRSAHEWNEGNQSLKLFWESLPKELREPVVPADPFKERLLWNQVPFINRTQLRRQLRSLASEQESAVLAINGAPGCGKTYSFNFISYLSQMLGTFKLVYCDLTEGNSTELDPGRLARNIARQLDFDPNSLPVKDAQDANWASDLVETIGSVIRNIDQPVWIVLDGVHQVSLPNSTVDFIKGLIKRAGITVRNLRIILMSYNDSVRTINVRASEETIELPSRLEVRTFLEELAKRRNIQPTPQQIDQHIDMIMAIVDAQHGLRDLPPTIEQAESMLVALGGGG